MLDMSNMLMVLLIHTTKVSFLLKVFMTLPHANGTKRRYPKNDFWKSYKYELVWYEIYQ